MNIQGYICLIYNVHPDPRIHEVHNIAERFKSILSRKEIEFIETFTTSVFPKLITYRNQKSKFLLWDNLFWDLFERNLLMIAKLENENIESSIVYDFNMSIYMLFLSSRFYSKPDLSLVLAKRYASTGFFIPPYYIKNDVRINLEVHGYLEYDIYCKELVLFHEIHHDFFRMNKKEKEKSFRLIRDMCKKMTDMPLPNETKESIEKLLIMKDESLLEELCCDVNSICTVTYLNSGGNGYKKNIAESVLKSAKLLSFFITDLKRMDAEFDRCYRINNESGEYNYYLSDSYIEKESRNYIVYYLAIALMGMTNEDIDTNVDLFNKDEMFDKYTRPFNHITNRDFVDSVFSEAKLYSKLYSPDILKSTRDIIIGWHKSI